jgi:CDP-paratose 2-epimerase
LHILVTGGCGFIGSHIALHLRSKGYKISVMDNLVRRGAEMNIANLEHHGVSFFHGDVRNPEDLSNLPTGIEFICETSAQPSVVTGYANPLFDITNNGLGAIHILEYARARRLPMIFWSSNRVYSADRLNALPRRETQTRFDYDVETWNRLDPAQKPAGFHPEHGVSEGFSIDGGQRSIYGLSKLIADASCQEYAHAFDMPIIVNRFGVISGIGQFGKADQGWVVWWAIAHWFGLPLTYLGWQGKQVRDVLFVEDMLALLELQIAQIPRFHGEVFNVGGGRSNSISLAEATHSMREISARATPITRTNTPRQGDIALYYTDNRKTTQLLGWKPQVDLPTGFKKIFDWIRQNEARLREYYALTQ